MKKLTMKAAGNAQAPSSKFKVVPAGERCSLAG
jgi:hypothetical protein